MKNILVFTLICFLCLVIFSSQKPFSPIPKSVSDMVIADSANLHVYYAFNAADIAGSDSYEDLHRLEIGSNLSKYYSYWVYKEDSLSTEWNKKNPQARSAPHAFGLRGKNEHIWSEYSYSEYMKDFAKNTLVEYARMPAGMNKLDCYYEEVIPIQNWEIEAQTKFIQGYPCLKATCNFRGRSYTAWFTMYIPVFNGPWKFGGLPGLILEVYDNEKNYSFECLEINYFKKKYPLKIYRDYENYAKIDRVKLLKLQKDIHEDFFEASGRVSMGEKEFVKEGPYYPIELE